MAMPHPLSQSGEALLDVPFAKLDVSKVTNSGQGLTLTS